MSFAIQSAPRREFPITTSLVVRDEVSASNGDRIVQVTQDPEASASFFQNRSTYIVTLFGKNLVKYRGSQTAGLLTGCDSQPFYLVSSLSMTFRRVNDYCVQIIEVDIPRDRFQTALDRVTGINFTASKNGRNEDINISSLIYDYWPQNEFFVDLSKCNEGASFNVYSYVPLRYTPPPARGMMSYITPQAPLAKLSEDRLNQGLSNFAARNIPGINIDSLRSFLRPSTRPSGSAVEFLAEITNSLPPVSIPPIASTTSSTSSTVSNSYDLMNLQKILQPVLSMLTQPPTFFTAAKNRHGIIVCLKFENRDELVFWANHDDNVVREVSAAVQVLRGSGANYWIQSEGVYFQYNTSHYPTITRSINFETAEEISLEALQKL